MNSTKTTKFDTEKECIDYLFNKRWPNDYICPICKNEGAYRRERNDRVFYQCKNKKCKRERSVTSGTIFANSPIPLRIWFKVIHFVAYKDFIDQKKLRDNFRFPEKTAWRIREIIFMALLNKDVYDPFFDLIDDNRLKSAKRKLSNELRKNPDFKKRLNKRISKKEEKEKAQLIKKSETKESRLKEKAVKKKMIIDILGQCNIDEMVKKLNS